MIALWAVIHNWYILGWDLGGVEKKKPLPAIPSTTHVQNPTHHHQHMTCCHIPKFTLFEQVTVQFSSPFKIHYNSQMSCAAMEALVLSICC